MWSDDEAELLLNVTHDYKIQHLVDGTCWKSVKSKYADILELFRKELPPSEEEASWFNKNYPHKPKVVTKENVLTKLKAVKKKFREVGLSLSLSHCLSVFVVLCVCIIGVSLS